MKYRKFSSLLKGIKGDKSARKLAQELHKSPTTTCLMLRGQMAPGNDTLEKIAMMAPQMRDQLYASLGRIPLEVLQNIDKELWEVIRLLPENGSRSDLIKEMIEMCKKRS